MSHIITENLENIKCQLQLSFDLLNCFNLGKGIKQFLEILVIIPSDALIADLKRKRLGRRKKGSGRNDYPIEVMWRFYVGCRLYHGGDVASFLRELDRNHLLCEVIGFKNGNLPTENACTNFKKSLINHQVQIDAIFNNLVFEMYDGIEGFGEQGALDGKIATCAAKGLNKNTEEDGRRDLDADYTIKKQPYIDTKGVPKIKKVTYFGYRIHILCDAKTDLPIAYSVTKASTHEGTVAKEMFKKLPEKVIENMKYLLADKGYDDSVLIELIKNAGIIPLIDIRNQWKNGDITRQYKDTDLVYTYDGQVFIVNDDLKQIKLDYLGFDKSRNALRYGYTDNDGKNRVYRIDIDYDTRVFTPLARDSKKYKKLYNARTSVERLNGRIDRDHKFERNMIRGLEKMKLEVAMSFIIMLANAKRHINRNETNYASLYN